MNPTPKAVTWYKVYLGVMIFFGLLTIGIGVFCWLMPEEWKQQVPEEDRMVLEIYKYMMPAVGGFAVLLYAIPLFLKPTPGRWVFDIVLICFGMGSCMVFGCVPLLIFYMKPEVKSYFGRPD